MMAKVESFHMGLMCKDPIAIERFYTKHFGFTRARVYEPGENQVVMIKLDYCYLELFKATEQSPVSPASGAGPEYPGWRHIAFKVKSVDEILEEMGSEAKITLGPVDMNQYVVNMRVCWLADPEGNIIELSEGYQDEANPIPLD